MKKEIKKLKSGFVILFAVTLAAILLAITLGVSNIALREVKFGTNARDTNDAFFAADTGIECAFYYDRQAPNKAFIDGSVVSMSCAGNDITLDADGSPADFWTFKVSQLGSAQQSCAIVTVDKTALSPEGIILTSIISKGYNNGGGTAGECNVGSNTVERQIEANY
jgi:hypothetical protein